MDIYPSHKRNIVNKQVTTKPIDKFIYISVLQWRHWQRQIIPTTLEIVQQIPRVSFLGVVSKEFLLMPPQLISHVKPF